jgi:hypothetical protein
MTLFRSSGILSENTYLNLLYCPDFSIVGPFFSKMSENCEQK